MASEVSEPDTPRTPASGSRRAQKVQQIFNKFDRNKDGALSKEEMANLVIAVNPRVKFSEDQIKAILDEVFRTYGEFIIPERGLSLDGLKRTYDDGAGDVDRDFEALNLQMGSIVGGFDTKKKPPESMMTDFKIDIDDGDGPAHEQTRKLLEDLQLLLRRHKVSRPHYGESVKAQAGLDPKELARGLVELRKRADRFTPLDEAFRAHMAMGQMLAQHDKHGEAITSFVKATNLKLDDVLAHFRTGNSYYAINAIAEAQSSYERALQGERNTPGEASKDLLAQVHTNLGIVLESQGLLFAAREHYQDAARLNQKHFRVLKLLGSAQLALGDLKDAKDSLEHSLYLNADFADAHMELASVLHHMGDHRAAKKEMMDALQLAPGDVDVKYNYGNLLRDMGDFKGAEKMYREVLKARPTDWKAMLNLAVALIGLDSTAEAQTVLVAALHLEERIEIHDTIEHLKRLSRKKKSANAALGDLEIAAEPSTSAVNGPDKDIANGELGSAPGFSSTFNQANGTTPSPVDLSQALEIRAFQRASHLDRVAPRDILRESTPALQQPMTKAQAELVFQRILHSLSPERFPLMFPLAMRAFNSTVLTPLETKRDSVDLGIILAIASLLASEGPASERKQVAFKVLVHRSGRQGDQVPQADVYEFLRSLRTVLLPGAPLPGDGKEMGEVLLGFREFEALLNNPQCGLGVYELLLRLEKPDKRHNAFCAVDEKRIVGMRFKEANLNFNLCSQSYCEGKVPKEFQDQSSFTFKVLE